jgi:hypothetical protein
MLWRVQHARVRKSFDGSYHTACHFSQSLRFARFGFAVGKSPELLARNRTSHSPVAPKDDRDRTSTPFFPSQT